MAAMTGAHLSALAEELLEKGLAGEALIGELQRRVPRLVRNIEADAARPSMLRLWGQSLNVDENTGTQIVPRPFIEALGSLAQVQMAHPVVHAGVTHTYGYLFSLIETPYGFKRDRWVEGKVAACLGLPRTVFMPVPRSGTLLTNVTYALSRIAFRGRRREQAALRKIRDVPAELREYRYDRLRGQRIIETLGGSKRQVQIYTDIVEAAHLSGQMRLLVYWWTDREEHARLITAFPITSDAAESLTDAGRCGKQVEIAIHYNGYVRTLKNGSPGSSHRGKREVFNRGKTFKPIA